MRYYLGATLDWRLAFLCAHGRATGRRATRTGYTAEEWMDSAHLASGLPV